MMTSVSTIEAHQAHCQPHLLTLRMIAHDDTGQVPTRRVVVEVDRATQAILAEAEAEAEAEAAARDAASAAARDAAGAVTPGQPGARHLRNRSAAAYY